MPDTRLQMLLRGQNVVGYRNYADDVVREFVRLAALAGIDVFRVFDALNDPRNLETAIAAVKENGKWVEGTISYTKSPVHNVQDLPGLCGAPRGAGRAEHLHQGHGRPARSPGCLRVGHRPQAGATRTSSCTCTATTPRAWPPWPTCKAVEAGADILDCAISSMSMGTSHPPTESMVAALAGTDRATGMDIELLEEISEYFRDIRKKYAAYESAFTAVDPAVLLWQIPGGMISNLSSQLKEQGHLEPHARGAGRGAAGAARSWAIRRW